MVPLSRNEIRTSFFPGSMNQLGTYLHIGQPKAGSTSIQVFLAQNRALLETNRYAFPDFLGEPSQIGLLLLSLSRRPGVRASPWLQMVADRFEGSWRRARSDLAAELIEWAKRHSDKNLVLSAEGLSTLLNHTEIRRLAETLNRLGRQVNVIIYVREPVSRAASAWSETKKHGLTSAKTLTAFVEENKAQSPLRPRLGGSAGLGNIVDWEEQFPGRVIVRLFDENQFRHGDLLRDFCESVGIPWRSDFILPGPKNVSSRNLASGSLNRFLPSTAHMKNYRPTSAEIRSIYADSQYALDFLRLTYFPNKETLWSPMFD